MGINSVKLRINPALIPERLTDTRGARRCAVPSPLSHLRVVDLTTELGWTAAKLCAALGADVVKVEPPGGDPGRKVGPFLTDTDDPNYSLHWCAHNSGKRSICVDLETPPGRDVLAALVRRSDFLFESFRPGYLAGLGFSPDELLRLNERLVIVAITPYGQDGPYAGFRASDLTLTGMGGLTWLCGDPDRAPTRIGAPQAMIQAGLQAAVAAMIGHRQRQRTGAGVYVDLSAQEAITLAIMPTRQEWDLNRVLIPRGGPYRQLAARRIRVIFECQDGYAAAFSVIGKELESLVRWLDEQRIPHDLYGQRWQTLAAAWTREATQSELDQMAGYIGQLAARYTKQRLSEEAQRRGIIIYPVNNPLDLVTHECLLARGVFQEVTVGGRRLRLPGNPFRMAGPPSIAPPPMIGEHTGAILKELRIRADRVSAVRDAASVCTPPGDRQLARGSLTPHGVNPADPSNVLAGITVTDFSWAVAGPLVTKYMVDFGADVVRIESFQRPDTVRYQSPFVDGLPGLNRSGAFYNINSGKKSLALNMEVPEAREIAWRLAVGSDVIVENFTSRVMPQWGLDYACVRAANPGIVYLSLSMEGRTGPHKDNRGFGTVLQAMAGISHLTGWPDRLPTIPSTPYTDQVVPHFATFGLLAALEHRRRTGEGQWLDISQMEVMLHALDATILDALARGRDAGRIGNRARNKAMAPHGVYRCSGTDAWIAIVIHDDADWLRLRSVLQKDGMAWADREDWTTVQGRMAAQDELDQCMDAWTSAHDAHTLMQQLQSAGIDAGVVQNQREIAADPQLLWRGHTQMLDHPEVGVQGYDGHSFRLNGQAVQLRRAPLLGEHSREVLKDRLSYSDAEIDALYETGALL
jgi:crotonobetainyl-CoA:carnitine CoA-transferase CaiB-like acyl-CoA transferase